MIRVPGLIDVELTLSVEYDFAPWAHPSTGEKLDFDYFHYTIRNAVAVWDKKHSRQQDRTVKYTRTFLE
ncbi:uncharacterized protein LOC142337846 isoform X2 [Convolutriloba macropyga]|uniref:uncharacterized protein LOC142337846 isoform X2 n=1 Tax=Convolutriloba macropyga TaxID=536237 RepID=UPI003F51B60B